MTVRRIVVLAFPGAQALDIAGPVEVFDMAHRLLNRPEDGYRVEIVSADGPLVPTCSQMTIQAAPLDTAGGPIDTLVVPGGWGMLTVRDDLPTRAWVREAADRSRRVASVCGGAFILAKAGLLDGRRATTHWAFAEELAQLCPAVNVDPKPIFVRDGKFTTSAGVSCGIDMALMLVEEDHGATFALEVARYLVMFVKRPGGQTQFSSGLPTQLSNKQQIREVQEWILANPDADLSVPVLAERASMSPRNFARMFTREVGKPPGQYVETVRVWRARELLDTTDLPVAEIARRCGFCTVETFLRAFSRTHDLTPGEYRKRFRSTLAEPIGAGL